MGEHFPELYRIASNLDALTLTGTSFHWDILFIRLIQDWELESIALFMDLIYSGVVSHGEADAM